jgi:hypothetical protein
VVGGGVPFSRDGDPGMSMYRRMRSSMPSSCGEGGAAPSRPPAPTPPLPPAEAMVPAGPGEGGALIADPAAAAPGATRPDSMSSDTCFSFASTMSTCSRASLR